MEAPAVEVAVDSEVGLALGDLKPGANGKLILGDRASALRVNPHTLGSAPCACVLLCSLYMNRL